MKNPGLVLVLGYNAMQKMFESEKRLPPIERITRGETNLEAPPLGGTFISVLRNGEDFRGDPRQMEEARRTPGGIKVGKLMPSAGAEARAFSEQQLGVLLDGLTAEEMGQIDIIVVASNTRTGSLTTPDGAIAPQQRCVETGMFLLEGIQRAMSAHGLEPEQLLNRNFHKGGQEPGAQPLALRGIEDLEMRPRTEEFFGFLRAEADRRIARGEEANIWAIYERDEFRAEREAMGVEGPEEISVRMQRFVERAEKLARGQHRRTPGRRLLVLAVAPRDVVGPWLNIQASGLSSQGHEVPRIENLAGFGIRIQPAGEAVLRVGDKEMSLGQ